MTADVRQCRKPGTNPDDWFAWPGSARAKRAKLFCAACPVQQDCREIALSEGIPEGVWGGLDREDRERIWTTTGGKPTGFMDAIDAAIGPLLQARRDFENFDPDVTEFDKELDDWSESA